MRGTAILLRLVIDPILHNLPEEHYHVIEGTCKLTIRRREGIGDGGLKA